MKESFKIVTYPAPAKPGYRAVRLQPRTGPQGAGLPRQFRRVCPNAPHRSARAGKGAGRRLHPCEGRELPLWPQRLQGGSAGSYALGRYIAKRLGEDIADLPASRILSDEVRKRLGEVTFVTATDGNHGRGVAWTGQPTRPAFRGVPAKGSPPSGWPTSAPRRGRLHHRPQLR